MYRDDLPATYGLTDSSFSSLSTASQWTRAEEKEFEAALVAIPENVPDRWSVMGQRLGKSAAEVRDHYEALLRELAEIDAGRVEFPSYWNDAEEEEEERVARHPPSGGQISFGKSAKQGETERKKGTPWTEEEHKFGKGDWRSISRNVVVTRTPTQVASHAQKFFLRQNSGKKDRKRQSIHDIKTVDVNSVTMPIDPQNWAASSTPPPVQQQPQAMQPQNWAAPSTPPMQQQMQQLANQLPNQGGAPMGYQDFGYSI